MDVGAIGRIYVNGTLRNLCAEYSGLEMRSDPAFARRCVDLAKYFTTHLGRAVNDLKLILPVTPDTASALVMAVS